jgi:hypothetical protein
MTAGVNPIMEHLSGSLFAQGGLPKTLALLTFGIVIYSIFIFYFYRFLARKNIINLDLSKYNRYEFGTVYRFFAIVFFIIEYIVILPFITFFWFGILAILVLLLAEGLEAPTILLISAGLVGAIRITSFVSEDLSRDLAKMIPLAFLGLALTTPGLLTLDITEKLLEIPLLLRSSLDFMIFIITTEVVLRVLDFVAGIFKKEESLEEEE